MIEYRIGNLLKQNDLNAIGHVANCFITMGSGIAKSIRETFPEAYLSDCETVKGDINKLGTFSFAKVKNGMGCYNIYGQFMFGVEKRHLDYDAVRKGLNLVKSDIKLKYGLNAKFGLPYRFGCCRAGGDWNIVLGIIKEIFENDPIQLVICEYKEYSQVEEDFKNKLRKAYKDADVMGKLESNDE